MAIFFWQQLEDVMNEQMRTLPLTYTVPEAGALLGISKNTAYSLARKMELPGVRRLGRRFIVSRAELEEYLSGDRVIDPSD